MTLRTRLLLALLTVAAIGMAAFGLLSVTMLSRLQLERVDSQVDRVAIDATSPNRPAPPPVEPEYDQLPSEFRMMFFDMDGTPLGTLGGPVTGGTIPALPPMDAASVRSRGDSPVTVKDEKTKARWRIRTVVQAPTEWQPSAGTAAVAMSLSATDELSRRLRIIEVTAGAGLLIVISIIAAILVRLGLRPLTRIERTAEAIAGGDLDRRVAQTDSHTEVGRLGTAFNVMVERLSSAIGQLEDSERRMRAFIADASHELRTPLTSVRGFAELYRRGGAQTDADVEVMMGRIEGAAIRMGMLVDDLLLLAKFDQERSLDLGEVDLVALAEEVVRDAATRAPTRDIGLERPPTPVRIIGDVHRLRQVLTNLVDNAVIHTSAPARITVAVSIMPASALPQAVAEAGAELPDISEFVVLDVRDEGPGIAAEDAERIFDRFYRAAESRSSTAGSGLGLAIVAAIVGAHGARIQLLSVPGAGSTFRILFGGTSQLPHSVDSGEPDTARPRS
ncbi:sensor histidine kinase [Nocardia altamirensis]|uniref:sensor histidine kinase n=1 Tax=Nocardia altamirensis TaxID=472158 RepID=UPI000AF40425|nr:HAMP domain-containing sensor histidine kinase [Nocardia altamirensis]